jgi:hypothetical protein
MASAGAGFVNQNNMKGAASILDAAPFSVIQRLLAVF